MSVFARPQGNPGGIRDGASRLTGLAERVGGGRLDTLFSAAGSAEAALPTRRVADFQGLYHDGAAAMEEAAQVFADVAGALADYADALETAQSAVDTASDGYAEAQRLLTLARNTGETQAESQARTDMSRHRSNADSAQLTFEEAQSRARSNLSGLATTWSPDGASTSAVDAWAASTAAILPQQVRLDREQIEAIVRGETSPQVLLDTGKNVQKALINGWYSWQAVTIGRESAAYQRTVQAIIDSRGQGRGARSHLIAARREQGLAGSHRYYKNMRRLQADRTALGHAQRRYPRAGGSHHRYGEIRDGVPRNSAARPGALTRFSNSRVMSGARAGGRLLAPLGAVTGGYDVYRAVRGGDGMSATDRLVVGAGGFGGAAAGSVATYALLAGAALGPVGLGVIAVGGAVAAGAWIYENREAIGEAAARAWDFGKDVGSRAVDGVKNVGKKVWKGLFGG
ncbi:hypothetical protein [Ornithinimicrobium pratense]|uniref:WXG100 family type VII secretion target n=1 Tax=Ornithinimicrobium pratense TaxID=2593973 RepID=A0A5J6V5L9_9MICO|nr:hypothetical protein [Ornithinimicrobium pratense]QFG68897.1 hypothetical protein FY030_09450 [Ornithinimicrobium pratense]